MCLLLGQFSLYVAMSGCHFFVPSQKTCYPVDGTLLVKECVANIGISIDVFLDVLKIVCIQIFFLIFESLQTSLLCILGELAGEGSLAVVVTCNM